MNKLTKITVTIKNRKKDLDWFLPLIILAVWSLDAFLSLFSTGFVSVDGGFIVSWIIKLIVISTNLYFFYNLFILEKTNLYKIFKTYAGYGIVIVYIGFGLPRISWEMKNLISEQAALKLWIFNFISCIFPAALYLFLASKKTQLKWKVLTLKELKKKKDRKKDTKSKPPIDIIVENVDMIIQCIIIVSLIWNFIFQLYIIPSESMVPTFLGQDRVVVTKFLSGPKIPYTDWKIPMVKKPHRGDIVVFESPHYTQNSLFKKLFHQFFLMISLGTFDIDRAPNGGPKHQYIVKRMIAGEGEKIMMVNDRVYIKKKGEADFKELTIDREKYAHLNLHAEPEKIKKHIRSIPTSAEKRDFFDKWDAWTENVKIADLYGDIISLHRSFSSRLKTISPRKYREILSKLEASAFDIEITKEKNPYQRAGMCRMGNFEEEIIYFYNTITNPDRLKYFDDFIQSVSTENISELNLYEINCKKLNYGIKFFLLQRYSIYLDLILKNQSFSEYLQNSGDKELFENSVQIARYVDPVDEYFNPVDISFDMRNFNEFPEGNNNYILPGKYFLMGDNRYNSKDFRFIYENFVKYDRSLDSSDEFSVIYSSNIRPYLLDENKILGIARARFWPLERIKIF